MPDIRHLLDSKQYYAAAWKVIQAALDRTEPEGLQRLRTDVGAIVKAAIAKNVWVEASKITRNFERYLHKEDYDQARFVINEITIPENIEELDDLEALSL